MQPGLISIAMPCFNAAASLPMALASLVAQSYTNWECILVDDGSQDNPQQVVDQIGDPASATFVSQPTRVPALLDKWRSTRRRANFSACWTQMTGITPGNWRGMVQTTLRNLQNGSKTEKTFSFH
ncbi:MAG: glycosyltransferase [Caldilineaceae bacterium]|nr:glycosyltransferase [Caldilineaceae bacterium]